MTAKKVTQSRYWFLAESDINEIRNIGELGILDAAIDNKSLWLVIYRQTTSSGRSWDLSTHKTRQEAIDHIMDGERELASSEWKLHAVYNNGKLYDWDIKVTVRVNLSEKVTI
jgi:hypothetical protein